MTDGTTSHLSVINEALACFAGGEIMSEEEDTELARLVVPLYYAKLRALLGMWSWSFASKTYKLDELAQTAENGYLAADRKFIAGWPHAFALPGALIGAPTRVMTDPRQPNMLLRNFFVEQATLYADRGPIYVAGTVIAPPAVWRADFRLAATKAIAADLCVPVTHDAQLAAALRAEAEGVPQDNGRGGLLGRALGADASGSRTKAALWLDPLTAARF